jgi:DNA-binding NtrC family response regulator
MAARRILIVDDEDDIREVAQVSLELVGRYEVLTASNGREGVRSARDEREGTAVSQLTART